MQLRVRSLGKTYAGGIQALRGVSLDVSPGVFGLLGPNGAGKTTLMRVIATLLEPDTGDVTFGEWDVLRQKTEIRRLLGYLPQEFGLDPHVSCEDMLDHLAVLKGILGRRDRRVRVEAVLERTHLSAVRRRRLGAFSGGMKQRFGIAQALLGDPRLLVVDEPTAGLDPEERRRLLDLLAELGERVLVILSTHIVADVAEMCQALAVLQRGRVVASGTPEELLRPLLGQVWEAEVSCSGTAVPAGATPLGSRREAGRSRLRVLGTVRPASHFEAVPPDLEDAYFAALRASED